MSARDTWRYLSKWPRLLVMGERVTQNQAAEIIVRTNNWDLWANDREWVREMAQVAGLALEDEGFPSVRYEESERFRGEIRGLDLEYLGNRRIVSTWIGGSHGWVDWDGRVGCSTWNIGKHPEHEEVEADLRQIAEAWPFLSMRVQLVADEGEGPLAAAWSVAGGAVEPQPVGPEVEKIRPVDELGMPVILTRLTSPYGERGCTLDQLRHALDLAREAARS